MIAPRQNLDSSIAAEPALRTSDTTRTVLSPRVATLIVACVVVAIVLILYTPWARAPFEAQDFDQMLPFLRAPGGFASHFDAVNRSFLALGRYFPLTIANVVVRWTIAGENTVAWQWISFVVLLPTLALAYAVLRRLGGSPPAAVAGMLGFLLSFGAWHIWGRLHYADQGSTPLLLAAVWYASIFRTTARPVTVAIAAGVALFLSALFREVMIAAVPFLVIVAACVENGVWLRPRIDRKLVLLFITTSIAALATAVPSLLLKRIAPPDSQAAAYSLQNAHVRTTLLRLHQLTFPTSNGARAPLLDLLYVAVIAIGFVIAWRHLRDRTPMLIAYGAAILLPLCGWVLFIPWPMMWPWYGYGYILGPSLLVTLSLTHVDEFGTRTQRRAAWIGAGVLVLFGALFTRDSVRHFIASRNEEADIASAIERAAQQQQLSSVYVVAEAPGSKERAKRLRQAQIVALGRAEPALLTVECPTAPSLATADSAPVVIVVRDRDCDVLPAPAGARIIPVVARYWSSFPSVIPRAESLSARLIVLHARS